MLPVAARRGEQTARRRFADGSCSFIGANLRAPDSANSEAARQGNNSTAFSSQSPLWVTVPANIRRSAVSQRGIACGDLRVQVVRNVILWVQGTEFRVWRDSGDAVKFRRPARNPFAGDERADVTRHRVGQIGFQSNGRAPVRQRRFNVLALRRCRDQQRRNVPRARIVL